MDLIKPETKRHFATGWRRATSLAAGSLSLALALSSCTSGDKVSSAPAHDRSPVPSSSSVPSPRATTVDVSNCKPMLESFRPIGGSKSGGENAVNAGDCAVIYNMDPTTSGHAGPAGVIQPEESFVIKCDEGKFHLDVVTLGGVKGDLKVDPSSQAAKWLVNPDVTSNIHSCQPQAPTPSPIS